MAEVKDIRGSAGCQEATEEKVNAAAKEVFCCPGLSIQSFLFLRFGTEVQVGPAGTSGLVLLVAAQCCFLAHQRCTATDGGL